MSAAMETFLNTDGRQVQYTSAHSSASNSIAERRIGLLQEKARALRLGVGLPIAAWAECYNTANFLINILPTTANPERKSPYEIKHGKPFDGSRLRPIGAKCYVKDHHAPTMGPVAQQGWLIGYSRNSHCYRVLMDKSTGRIVESDDVRFLNEPANEPRPLEGRQDDEGFILIPGIAATKPIFMDPTTSPSAGHVNPYESLADDGEDVSDQFLLPEGLEDREEDLILAELTSHRPARTAKPSRYLDTDVYSRRASCKRVTRISYSEAANDPILQDAMKAELKDLFLNGKIKIVDLPPGEPEITGTWAHKKKTGTAGNSLRAKSRLCPRGYQQIPGKHYDPAKIASTMWHLAIASCS